MTDPTIEGHVVDGIVSVVCPYCGDTHTHGWPDKEEIKDHRLSHCVVGPGGGYWIVRAE